MPFNQLHPSQSLIFVARSWSSWGTQKYWSGGWSDFNLVLLRCVAVKQKCVELNVLLCPSNGLTYTAQNKNKSPIFKRRASTHPRIVACRSSSTQTVFKLVHEPPVYKLTHSWRMHRRFPTFEIACCLAALMWNCNLRRCTTIEYHEKINFFFVGLHLDVMPFNSL